MAAAVLTGGRISGRGHPQFAGASIEALHCGINVVSEYAVSDGDRPEEAVTNIEMTSVAASEPLIRHDQVAPVHLHVVQQLHQAQRNLLATKSLASLVKYLIEDFPRNFGSAHAELHLHDPDGDLSAQLTVRKLFGDALVIHSDSDALYRLHPERPVTTILDMQDERMFAILATDDHADGAVMMPLVDGSRLLGSYHLALHDGMTDYGEQEQALFAMLGQLCAATLLRVVEYQRVDQLTLLDPVTEMGNLRAFRRNLLREIYWSRRVERPVALLSVSVDELDELGRSYGEVASHFVQRRVSQRLCSDLRATDYIAHTSETQFTILLPGCNEPHGHDIGERIRRDIERFAIDDGRGAVLYVSLSIGLVCWEPTRHPVESSDRLAGQMESEAMGAMDKSIRAGGNRISVARLGLLML